MPFVSILMCVYNDENYLAGAIESILNQSYRNLEIIIINDCSTDNSEEIILGYKDSRIVYVKNESNIGLASSLNKGLDLVKGDYVARMDSDDIAFSDRIEKQVKFMERNPHVILSGAWIKFFGDEEGTWKTETDHDFIKAKLLLNTPLAHPTWIFRKRLIDNKFRYDANLRRAQDYDFLYRASQIGKLASLPEIILKYRVKHNNRNTNNHVLALQTIRQVRDQIFKSLQISYSEKEYELHSLIGESNYSEIKNKDLLQNWLLKLLKSNQKTSVFSPFAFKSLIGEIWIKYHFFNKNLFQMVSSPKLLLSSLVFALKKSIQFFN